MSLTFKVGDVSYEYRTEGATRYDNSAWLVSVENIPEGAVRFLKGRLFYASSHGLNVGRFADDTTTRWTPVDVKDAEAERKKFLESFA